MCDRYEDYVSKGKSEEETYKETIKAFGFFKVNEEEFVTKTDSYSNDWADIFIILSLITVIFSTVCVFFNTFLMIFFAAASLSMFIISLKQFDNKAKKYRTEGDILGFKFFLRKKFTFLKNHLVFFPISFSLIAAYVFAVIIIFLSTGALISMSGVDINEFSIVICIILTVIVLLGCGVASTCISVKQYSKLKNEYYN